MKQIFMEVVAILVLVGAWAVIAHFVSFQIAVFIALACILVRINTLPTTPLK